ncbi:MAG TPA: ATPase, T2SS/T4P/T4SS family [Clostridia bacterium]|nr:ATPase, T2SS/T4P/T4SS family [Clostridia bacterium]
MLSGRAAFMQAVASLSENYRKRLSALPDTLCENAQELRLIMGACPQLRVNNRALTLRDWLPITEQELSQCYVSLCGQAVHSHQRELAQGYLTLAGGHRAGFAATAVYGGDGALMSLRSVNAIVLRIAREYRGVADRLLHEAFSDGVCGLLIAGAPASGKTTVLRDLAVSLASGAVNGCDRVVVVDERGELSGFCHNCCVLSGYDKGDGLLMAVRNLSPQVILCDELGTQQEVAAVIHALNCGVSVITTIHAGDRQELTSRPAGKQLLGSGAFNKVAVLSEFPHPSSIREVYSVDDLAAHNGADPAGAQLLDWWDLSRRTVSTAHFGH